MPDIIDRLCTMLDGVESHGFVPTAIVIGNRSAKEMEDAINEVQRPKPLDPILIAAFMAHGSDVEWALDHQDEIDRWKPVDLVNLKECATLFGVPIRRVDEDDRFEIDVIPGSKD